jgi:lysophospholipase L1-like esterase
MDVKIRGFGACLIGGFPHGFENSFFHLATERLRLETGHLLAASIYTLGGFPAPRALRHLPSHGLADHPEIVVLQFGSSDLVAPVRRKRHLRSVSAQARVAAHPANSLHLIRWRVQGIIGDLLGLKSITAPEAYLEAMNQMIRTVAAQSAIPVVISPFVLGSPRSDRIARACVPALAKVVAAVPTARYVNAYAALDAYPRREILLHDGTHLTIQGQVLVSECLYNTLARLLRDLEMQSTRLAI